MKVAHNKEAQVFAIDLMLDDAAKADLERLYYQAVNRYTGGYGKPRVRDGAITMALVAVWLEKKTEKLFKHSDAGKWLNEGHADYMILNARYHDILDGLVTIMISDADKAALFKLTFVNDQLKLAA